MVELSSLSRRLRRTRRTLARAVRASVPILLRCRAVALNRTLRFCRWLRAVLILYLWISFEGEMHGWALFQREAAKRLAWQTRGWHRFVYCLMLSLAGGQVSLALGMHSGPNMGTFLLCAAHGAAVHIFWQRGVRWCKQILGVRPSRSSDPTKPYAGLDLGN
jgi:hypothetical protein